LRLCGLKSQSGKELSRALVFEPQDIVGGDGPVKSFQRQFAGWLGFDQFFDNA
jgi:hypothetical protein